ncbi:bile acid:sodium symporter family protein [Paracoccus sp. FO-3]|uniref:bile acid:sodium symporter family protein n=1 Tax=Paracoccus sp. FO-3 TaxID=1335059 RepID=UPI00112990DA|nr:bile acid:sodium symporter family protein [Paracoccus sp. FO-3]
MDSSLVLVALPVALAIIMLGLGLHLAIGDFTRIFRQPKPIFVALGCQLVILPLICFALVVVFALPPALATGMMLLAASPGGTMANLYSHLFRGDVALNISLTALNSVIAIATLPVMVNLAIIWFRPGDMMMGLAFGKVLEVFFIVLVPVVIGMAIRRARPALAGMLDRPVCIASAVILLVVVVGAIVANFDVLAAHMTNLLGITVLFCAISLAIGYVVPLRFGMSGSQAIASAFEVGIHNAALAIVVAQSILGSIELSLPAAVYGVIMFPLAAAFGFLATRSYRTA